MALARTNPITSAELPADLQAHLTGPVAQQVDNSAQSGNEGADIEDLSVIFIIVLLVLIFRSLIAPLITLAPAFVVVEMAGPLIAQATHAGLKVSSLAQLMLIVLVLGAGTDYGLFLVFRVREAVRDGMAMRDAVVHSLGRVGESITFSAGTVIAALLSLLAASFGIYSNLGIPLAIGIGLMLPAGLTLLPALLAIFGRAVFWPSKLKVGTNRIGVWGRVSGRIVQRPVAALTIGLVFFGALSFAVNVATAIGATDNGVAGEAPAFYDVSSISTSDLQTVIPIAIAIIAVLLGLVMRSLVAPIYLIASVGLSYLASLGLSVLLFGRNGLTFILPLREAVHRAMAATSITVTSAGLVLAGTFAVFAIAGAGAGAGGGEITEVGAGIALGVLMDTFLVRTVLVPATVVLLGRWNWWPAKLGRKDRELPPPQQEQEPATAGAR